MGPRGRRRRQRARRRRVRRASRRRGGIFSITTLGPAPGEVLNQSAVESCVAAVHIISPPSGDSRGGRFVLAQCLCACVCGVRVRVSLSLLCRPCTSNPSCSRAEMRGRLCICE